jgi:hypothetical protein
LKLCNHAKHVDIAQEIVDDDDDDDDDDLDDPHTPKKHFSSDHCANPSLSLLNQSNNYCNILPHKSLKD